MMITWTEILDALVSFVIVLFYVFSVVVLLPFVALSLIRKVWR